MDTGDRTILRRLIVALILILLLGAVIWIFFVRNADKKQTNQKSGNADTSQGTGGNPNPGTANQPAAGSSQAQGDPPTPAPTPPTQAQQPSTLTNTGPGNVVALFAGASTIGGVAHYLYNRKRR